MNTLTDIKHQNVLKIHWKPLQQLIRPTSQNSMSLLCCRQRLRPGFEN